MTTNSDNLNLDSLLESMARDFHEAFAAVTDLRDLDAVRVRFLGKKGSIKGLLKGLGALPAEQRPQAGAAVNQLYQTVEKQLEDLRSQLEQQAINNQLQQDTVDITLPGRENRSGALHPVSLVMKEVTTIFARMGYDIHYDREIETDYYNFEALNFPADHPARDMQDTFFLGPDLLLRSHTSNGQIHYMENHQPPIKVIVPGRVYRRDSDPTHLPMFHQIEGLLIGKDISMAHLKWTLETFLHEIFGPDARMRFRPSFFPFTEPSAEADLWFEPVPGKGRWLELLGAGLVDPNVLLTCRIDPEEWTGFAFGLGVERLAMVKYGIPDIRMFYENDIRVLEQFTGALGY